MTIFSIFKKREEDANVLNAALSAVCNIVIDFSPLRPVRSSYYFIPLCSADLGVEIYLEQGLMERLRELLSLGDPALKLGALWAVKNLLRKSTTETKRSVMGQLGWDRVVEYVRFYQHLICAHDVH